uniref:MRG domain-containing protein n=1 Tax=Meloidogyne floridensis TaxID=298350 RepID=A0A915P341_9BILA
SVHEAETSNETISVDSKKTDKGKKKKNKGKSKIKEQDNNKKKNTKKDLEDMKFLDGIIKQKNRQLRELDEQNKKAVKEARKANKSEFWYNPQELQKIREIITKNDELLNQPKSEKIVPGSPAIIHINTAFESALNDYYWIEQSIISFFEEIKDYFLLFDISFEMITNWRYDDNFVEKFEDNLYSISMKYQPLAEHNKELILLGHKFLEFYRSNEYNVFDIIEEDLEKSLYFVLDLKQKEGEELSVEYAISESIFKNKTTLYTMNILYFNMDKIEDATLHDLAVNIYNFLQYSILFNEIIQKQKLVDNRLTIVGPSILVILYEKIMPSIEIENESLYDIVDKPIALIMNEAEFPEIIDNTVKILQDVISNILIETSDKENETEENLEVKEKRKKYVKDVVECFRKNFSYLIKNCFRTFTYVHTLSRNVQVNNELNKNKTEDRVKAKADKGKSILIEEPDKQ